MAKNLVIVESPAKADTIHKYLGRNYTVIASMGHVIDLPSSQMGVDIEDHFKPKYITIRGKGDTLKKLKKEAKASQTVFLATDPDREGEAISYHLANALNIPLEKKCRVTFNEITKSTVQKSMKEPREIDLDLVNAQQARRVLDRIVGYQISPILWKKVKKGLSAGRVQSVATRLICDREDEINAFVPEEYWSLDAILAVGKRVKDQFVAKFYGENGKKEELSTKEQVDAIIADLKGATYTIVDVKEKEKIRRPMPPFTTSTLQQEASRKLNFATKKTMMIAQQLYEGIQIKGEGKIGLITYMRTDSLRISTEAQQDAKEYIKGVYGENYIPATPNVYKAKGASQDAHEAIRSTNVRFTPDEVKESLNNDQFKLYKLIWSRFVASQMANAVLDTVSVDIDGAAKKKKVYRFKSSGFTIKFNGYMAVYHDSDEEKEKALPKLTKDQQVEFENLQGDQHFTQPPARYTEATLVKTMEELGIGRPSTYSPTISTIMSRGYVIRDKKQLLPTELGAIITSIMKKHFAEIVNVEFTANMEKQLDDIADGDIKWIEVLEEFYAGFGKTLEKAEAEMENVVIADEESDVICEKCGRNMVYKMGRFRKFLACPGFPECRNAKPIIKDTGVLCPKCGGKILEKKSKKGKIYFGCEKNPTCDFMIWDKPLKDEKCPKCGGIVVEKTSRGKTTVHCIDCDFVKDVPSKDAEN